VTQFRIRLRHGLLYWCRIPLEPLEPLD
jgi:hypothetical protein